jgi:hypothetical protein
LDCNLIVLSFLYCAVQKLAKIGCCSQVKAQRKNRQDIKYLQKQLKQYQSVYVEDTVTRRGVVVVVVVALAFVSLPATIVIKLIVDNPMNLLGEFHVGKKSFLRHFSQIYSTCQIAGLP